MAIIQIILMAIIQINRIIKFMYDKNNQIFFNRCDELKIVNNKSDKNVSNSKFGLRYLNQSITVFKSIFHIYRH